MTIFSKACEWRFRDTYTEDAVRLALSRALQKVELNLVTAILQRDDFRDTGDAAADVVPTPTAVASSFSREGPGTAARADGTATAAGAEDGTAAHAGAAAEGGTHLQHDHIVYT